MKRALTAGSWVAAGHMGSQILRLGSNIIMTRLLVPEMFGIMTVANVLIMGLSLFSDIGLQQNIIQSKRGDSHTFLNTVWTIQVIRGCFIWLFALTAVGALSQMNYAGWFAKDTAYADPAMPYILSVLSFTALISGFNSTKLATSNRHLNMGKIIRIELFSQIGALTVMIGWAVLQKSIWALVAGSIAGALLKLIFSHVLLTGISNRFHWNAEAFSEIFHFGKWVFLSSILGFLAVNGDRLMLGALVDAATMGQFGIAFVMASAIRMVIQRIISRVAFPVLSEVVRTRPGDLRQTYYKMRLPADILLLFLTGLMFTAGHFLIELLYDERYHDAGWMFEILSIGLVQVRFSLAEQCYLAMGEPRLLVPVSLIRVAGLLILLPLCFNAWGLIGAVWIAGGAVLLPLPLTIYLKAKYGIFLLRRELYVIPFLFLGLGIGSLISAGM